MDGQVFRVSVLDGVSLTGASGTSVRLRGLGRRLLASLVARSAGGVAAHHLTDGDGVGPSAASVSASAMRLRRHLGSECLPEAHDGIYRLQLPPGAVDAWRLSELAGGGSLGSTSVDELRRLLGAGSIFGSDPFTVVLERARFGLLNDQRALLARLAQEAPALGAMLGQLLVPYAENDPDNQLFVGLLARSLHDAGDRRGAARVLDGLNARLRETGYALDDGLADLRRELLTTGLRPADREVERTTWTRGWIGDTDLPAEVWSRALSDSDATPSVTLIRAGSGFGKSHLIAGVAARAESAGWRVESVTVRDGRREEFNLLRQLVNERITSLDGPPEAQIIRLRDALIAAGRGGPVLLTVDDAQWLDPTSLALLAFLGTSSLPMRVAVVIATRSDSESMIIPRLSELATNDVELVPLDEEGICALVLDRDPDVGQLAAKNIAGALTAQSAGIPGIAVLLLPQHLDGTAMTDRVHFDPVVGTVDGLDPDSLAVGRVAAALGNPVRIDLVDALAGIGRQELATALGELERRKLLVRESAVRYQLAHALVGQAFIATCPIGQWAQINAAAARLVEDPDRRAHHLYEGLPISDPRETVEALVGSARHLALTGDPAAAGFAFGRAAELEPLVDTADAIVWSRALDLSGFRGRANDVRDAHFPRLITGADHEMAFRLAISGHPEAESASGDRVLLRRLSSIDESTLPPSSAWLHAWHSLRQELFSGSGVDGERFDGLTRLARSAGQRVSTVLLRRHAMWSESPHGRLALLDECRPILDAAPPETQAEYRVVRCMDSYEAGSLVGADAELLQLEALGPLEPRRQWHVRMLRASIASDRGLHVDAEGLRREGLRIAMAAGLADAEFGQLGPMVTDLMIRRDLAALAPMIDRGTFDAERRSPMVAVGSQVCAAVGQGAAAEALAERVLGFAEREPGITSRFQVALVCEVLGRIAGGVVNRERARSLLRPLSGGNLMLGAGATTLGPVDRYLAFVADGAERVELLLAARDAAVRSGAVRWEAVIERDLFELTGDPAHQLRFESIRASLSPDSLGSE